MDVVSAHTRFWGGGGGGGGGNLGIEDGAVHSMLGLDSWCVMLLNPYFIPSSGIVRQDSMWDSLVFHKVRATMGGRVRIIVTGSAPIAAKVLDFLRVAFGCNVRGVEYSESSINNDFMILFTDFPFLGV